MVGQNRDPELPDPEESHESPDDKSSVSQSKPQQSQVGKLWDAFGSPEEPVNILPTAKYNNAEELKRQREASTSLREAVKSGNGISDLTSFHKTPCARDSLLLGMGAGFGLGGVRGILGGTSSAAFHAYGKELTVSRNACCMACMQLGSLHICSYLYCIVRTLSATTPRGNGQHETGCCYDAGDSSQETTGEG